MSDTQRIEKLDPEELEKNRLAKEAAANKTPESTEAEPKQEAPVSAAEAAQILEKIYQGKLISPVASRQMLNIPKEQQFDDLIPWHMGDLLPEQTIAHKTGGLPHVVHDVAIVDGGWQPYILCFMGSEVAVPQFGRFIQDMSLKIYQKLQNEQ